MHVHVILGQLGTDGRWAVERLLEYGVDVGHIAEVSEVTGHAIISVDDSAENSIVLWPGANYRLEVDQIGARIG